MTPSDASLLEKAQHLLANNRPEEAYMVTHTLLSQQPNEPTALVLHAQALALLGETETGLQHTLDALQLLPEEPALYACLVQLAVEGNCPDLALNVLQQAKSTLPNPMPALWLEEGRLYRATQRPAEAQAQFEQALQQDPNLFAARFELARLLYEAQHYDQALTLFQQLHQDQPSHLETCINLGYCLAATGRHQDAMTTLEAALELEPTRSAVWLALGNVAVQASHQDKALSSYQQALVLTPNNPELRYRYALALMQWGQTTEATHHLKAVYQDNPDHVQAGLALAALYMETRQFAAALSLYEQLHNQFPSNWNVVAAYAEALDEHGNYEKARYLHQRLLIAQPHHWPYRLSFGRSLPIVAQTKDDILIARERLSQTLNTLSQLPITLPLEPACNLPDVHPPFYLAYQPDDERLLRQRYSHWIQQTLQPHHQPLIQLPISPPSQGPVRLGILVTRHHEAIFCRLMKGFLAALNPQHIDLLILCPTASVNRCRQELALPDSQPIIGLSGSLPQQIRQIKALNLNALHFYEVGTDTENYLLPFFRLAPLQLTSWGYPVTSGIPTLDVYASAAAFETQDADSHYSEQLWRLPGPPGVFQRPKPSAPRHHLKTHFNLQSVHSYTCPQNLFKLHPDFDRLVGNILRRDPQGVFVLLDGLLPPWKTQLLSRFERTLHDVLDRIKFLPRQTPQGYIDLLAASDLILDPLYYGGGSSSLEALGVGTPVITCPGPYQRSRHTAGFYRLMQLEDLIVSHPEHYHLKALELGTNPATREHWHRQILEKSTILFNNPTFVNAYQDHLWQHCRQEPRPQNQTTPPALATPTPSPQQ